MKKIILSLALLSVSVFAANHIINQRGKTFIPHEITVKPGDTIIFKNSDPFAHNAYTDDEANEFDIGMQAQGTDKRITVRPGGNFSIECAIHPNMLLEVTVLPGKNF
jgi:plastocyanin